MNVPDLPTYRRLAAEFPVVPIVRELTADTVTPYGMLLRLARWGRHPFLLESVEGGERVARWSFAGANPRRVITLHAGQVAVDGKPVPGEPVASLHRLLVGPGRPQLEAFPPFVGGAVGYLAYDTVRYLERLPDRLPDPLALPEAWFGDYRVVAALDRVRQRLLLVATPDPRELGVEQAYAKGVAELDDDEGLDEEGLAARRGVVDDPPDPGAGLGADRDDVAAVPEGDDRLLEGRTELRGDELVEAPSEPLVGESDGGPEAAEARRRRVEELAGRVEAPGQGRSHGG